MRLRGGESKGPKEGSLFQGTAGRPGLLGQSEQRRVVEKAEDERWTTETLTNYCKGFGFMSECSGERRRALSREMGWSGSQDQPFERRAGRGG